MKYLQSTGANIAAILGFAGVSFFLLHQSGALKDAGMAAIVLNWLPFIVGIGTIIIYLLVRLFKTDKAWIVSLIGILFNLGIVISAYMDKG